MYSSTFNKIKIDILFPLESFFSFTSFIRTCLHVCISENRIEKMSSSNYVQ